MKLLLLLLAAGLAVADQAPKAKHNPRNIIAVADFPQAGSNLYTKGYVFFTSHKGGPVKVHVDMTGLPQTGGPFFYHIHENQIFSSDDCDAAGAAFDPYDGLQKCPRVGDDSFCQVGDLSGKHGWINATCYQAEYTDPYVALNPSSAAYIVGRSLVFHSQDSTRFACANINIATKEQYQELFGYSKSTESEGVLEFQEDVQEVTNEESENDFDSVVETEDSDSSLNTEQESGSSGNSRTVLSETSDADSEDSGSENLGTENLGSGNVGSGNVDSGSTVKAGKKAAADVDSSNSSDFNYVPAEAGAGNLFTGVVGTALGLVLGFFF